MKKSLAILSLLLILTAFSANASISIDSVNKERINLGDKIVISYNLSTQSDMESLFRLTLKCDSLELPYYTIPVSLKQGHNKSIIAPPLTANMQMTGKCAIKAALQSTEGLFNEETNSGEFEITDQIGIKIQSNSQNFLPGERLEITGDIEQSFNPAKKAIITIGTQSLTVGTGSDTFNYSIELSKTMKSGEHKVSAAINDSYGNKGEAELTITIAQVATTLLIRTDAERINPGEGTTISATILDQANDTMAGKINIKISSQEKKEVLTKDLDSDQSFFYKADQHMPPGVYSIKAASGTLKSEKKITINAAETIEATFDGKRIINIKNTGNIDYEKYYEVKLTSNGKEITILKKLNLKPGNEIQIDLFKEVPAGTYTVSFVTNGKQNEFGNIKTADERPALKKTTDGMKGVTGMLIGTGEDRGLIFKRPLLAVFTVIAIMGLTIILFRAEKERRKELASRKNRSQSDEAEETEAEKPEQARSLRDDPDHKKFVENMLKEKQFK
ncbi:hypothetical protein HYU11_05395 [Candidatus Woesearchaeota archaeon]|nr:hypothetical protein [Candidatus Woesearchaeota archaeon]